MRLRLSLLLAEHSHDTHAVGGLVLFDIHPKEQQDRINVYYRKDDNVENGEDKLGTRKIFKEAPRTLQISN